MKTKPFDLSEAIAHPEQVKSILSPELVVLRVIHIPEAQPNQKVVVVWEDGQLSRHTETGQDVFNAFCKQRDLCLIVPGGITVNWPAMPAWANWVAMDQNGTWAWFMKQPEMREDFWHPRGYPGGVIPMCWAPGFDGNWKDSLTERPTT